MKPISVQNPYASPKSFNQVQNSDADERIWRDGKLVILVNGTKFPHRCVKCNQVTEGPGKMRKVTWHSPWAYLAILLNVIIYLIIYLVIRKKAKIDPGLCAAHMKRRKFGLLTALLILATSLVMFFLGVSKSIFALHIVGFVFLIISFVIAIIWTNILTVRKINGDVITLSGAGQEFLNSLQEH